ncbi:hypothetical protein LguiA_013462 [Lonicera macranthoides]
MQSDEHLVQYPFEGPWSLQNAYWASGTVGAGSNVTLNLDDDGHLYLFNSSTIIRNLTNGGYPTKRLIYLAYKMISENGNCEQGNDFRLRAYTYAELEVVTSGFTDEVGSGSFGTVYKRTIQNNQKDVAVKGLKKGLVEGERELQKEMKSIGKTHHRNLV